MKPINIGGHTAYQQFVIRMLREYGYSPYPTDAIDDSHVLTPTLLNIINLFFALDLTWVDTLLAVRYSYFGRSPRLPSSMLRSRMLSLYLRFQRNGKWAEALRTTPLYAIISGFDPGNVPGHSTFYDFENRLWDGKKLTDEDHIKPIVKKVKKPKNPSDKAEPEEGRATAVQNKLKDLEQNPPSDSPDWLGMFNLFKPILQMSVDHGIIDPDNIVAAGDGTEIVTASELTYLHTEQRLKRGLVLEEGMRYYNQPSCDWGWDSHRKTHYAGYNCYIITVRNEKLQKDLPLFPLLLPASTHDSVALPEVLLNVEKFLPDYHIRMILLDSAHDSMDEARFLKYGVKADGTQRNLQAITDLNVRRGINFEYQGFTVKENGVPICSLGRELIHGGSDYTNERTKYTCPCFADPTIQCPYKDCPHRNGTPFYTHVKDNPRLFTLPARCTKKFDNLYKMRTSSERCNSLIKGTAYDIEETHRTSEAGWYFTLYVILICIHVKSWGLEKKQLFQKAWDEAYCSEECAC